MKTACALALGCAAWLVGVGTAQAKSDDDEAIVTTDEDEEEAASEDDDEFVDSSDFEDEDEEEVIVNDKGEPIKKKAAEFKKQDLRGHDVSAGTATNLFEKDRFFVDKVDTKATKKGTLIQGSVTSSSFLYRESSGAFANPAFGTAASKFSRLFTDLRLQTDFRHIGGGRWDARIDARARLVTTPDNYVSGNATVGTTEPNRIQSGFNGTNEYEIRELLLARSGKRSDIIIGRQFINDLGALKVDGVRVDYAKSETFTLLGFGGLFPLRGSRSLTTDYIKLADNQLNPSGRLVGAGGFGGAYRTVNAHGAIGGVVLAPLPPADESPRVFAVSNGYYRSARAFDAYHFAIIDLVGSAGFALTNVSAGINYRPNQRLRLTGSFNRVDTETLAVQANAFLDPAITTGNAIPPASAVYQNDAQILRLASNSARGGLSAGLGELQRFEITTSVAFRFRPGVILLAPDGTTQIGLNAARGIEVYLSVTDRQSIKGTRLSLDATKTLAVGQVAFQRSEVTAVRFSASKEFSQGRGEWEAEVGYTMTKDKALGTGCASPMGTTIFAQDTCFGSSTGSVLSLGGNGFYRINRDWFAMGNLFLSRFSVTPAGQPADPTVTGITGFFRVAYRF